LRKLEYVDRVIGEAVRGRRPIVRSRARVDPAARRALTLGEYYEKKRERYGGAWLDLYDRDLRRLFSDDPRWRGRPAAAAFLRRLRGDIRRTVAEWTGVHPYSIDQVLQGMIERCRELELRLAVPLAEARSAAVLLLTVHTMNNMYVGRYEFQV
jgi:hypothetical protein